MENNKKLQQEITSQLQGGNIGVNKTILNINAGSSELPTNNNSEILYSLKQPIKLDIGDKITLLQSFVQEAGLDSSSISFEEDISADMRFMYYKQSDCGDVDTDLQTTEFMQYPRFMPDFYTFIPNFSTDTVARSILPQATNNYGSNAIANYVGDCNFNMNQDIKAQTAVPVKPAKSSVYTGLSSGPNGQTTYLMETVVYNNQPTQIYYRPVYGSKKIIIKAGNYTLESLANIITSQLNGSLGKDDPNKLSNAMLDKLYFPKKSGNNTPQTFGNTVPFFNKIDTDTTDFIQEIGGNNENDNYDRTLEGCIKQLNYSDSTFLDIFQMQSLNTVAADQMEGGFAVPLPDKTTVSTARQPSGQNFNYQEGLLTPTRGGGVKQINFYINRAHLYQLYERKGYFWNRDHTVDTATDDATFIANGGNRPPTMLDLLNTRIDSANFVIPYASTGTPVTGFQVSSDSGSPIQEGVYRIAKVSDAMIFSGLFPTIGGLEAKKTTKFAGTSAAALVYDNTATDRFSFKNLHEYYKLPSKDSSDNAATGFAAQQATKYNNPYGSRMQTIGTDPPAPIITNDPKFLANAVYPIDSSSGICINNFDYDLVKNTKVYLDLIAKIKAIDVNVRIEDNWYKESLVYELYSKPFDEFFANAFDAEAAWKKSLWFRIGFSYSQIGNISENLETISSYGGGLNSSGNQVQPQGDQYVGSYNRMNLKQKGIMTHNEFDYTQIVASGGLGKGFKTSGGTPSQSYTLQSYYEGSDISYTVPGDTFTTACVGMGANIINLLETSKLLEAKNLPVLNNNKSYLVIESDIVNINYKDSRAQWGNILGIMTKENSTNDTLFGAGEIEFTVTEPKLLSDINIFIKNPDGTLASNDVIGVNNAFIIQIEKPINPGTLPLLQSI